MIKRITFSGMASAGRFNFIVAIMVLNAVASGFRLQGAVETEQHVFFENSLPVTAYHESAGVVVSPSQLELVDGKLPLDDHRWVSAPNSLRLKWRSAPGGEWRVKISSMERYGRGFEFKGDTLTFWCYSDSEIPAIASPRINLQDSDNTGSGTTTLLATVGNLPARRWVKVKIPLSDFKSLYPSTTDVKFDPAKLRHLWLTQGLDDDEPHAVCLDDIQIVPGGELDQVPPAAPTELRLRNFERHFELSWRPSADEDVLRYVLYRSSDGTNYLRVKTQRADRARMVDFVGSPDRKYFYRMTAQDLSGNESVASETVSGTTHSMNDDELMQMVQEACFRYYWDGGHPHAGMAVEILPGDKNLVAVGASGFGIMSMLVGVERQFISREDGAARLLKIVRYLEGADRFHGAWPHFLDGRTGKTSAYFGKYDDGGDLVETAFLVQGLLAARQYFDHDNPTEREVVETITRLWHGVEWDWYRKSPQSDFLYWHWSANHGWYISHPLVGWNETLIVYLLAIASPTHPVPATLYHTGWAGQSPDAVAYRQNWSRTTQGDHYTNGNSYYNLKLEVGEGSGGDLFFTQFSFLGFDPRGIRDAYADYFENNRNIARINHAYCVANPRRYLGYATNCWGLSAGINSGGGRPLPRDDNGTICCSASIGSMPYTPEESLGALKYFYRELGDKLWGEYGFHDGFNQTQGWFEPVAMGLNQAIITVMIENHRSGLIWRKFMANPEVRPALQAIGFHPSPPPFQK